MERVAVAPALYSENIAPDFHPSPSQTQDHSLSRTIEMSKEPHTVPPVIF